MDAYRQLQAERWKRVAATEQPPVPSQEEPQETSLSLVAVDTTSIQSLNTFIKNNGIPRTGILFGTIAEDGYTVIVDAIYECSQDVVSGLALHDARLPMVLRISKLMGLRPVGILTASQELMAIDLLRVINSQGDPVAHVILSLLPSDSQDSGMTASIPTPRCFTHAKNGSLTKNTSIKGNTVDGGLDGTLLYKKIPVLTRTVNSIIHTGFYRLNRPNHIPTMNDAKAFIVVRKEKANIQNMHLQFADYHLILFLADVLGESTAERIILSIFQEEDELVEDIVELLLTSGDAW